MKEYMVVYRYDRTREQRRMILHASTLFEAVDDARQTIIADEPYGPFEIISAQLQELKT